MLVGAQIYDNLKDIQDNYQFYSDFYTFHLKQADILAEEKSKYKDIKDLLIREQQKRNELLDFVDNLKNMINQGNKSQV